MEKSKRNRRSRENDLRTPTQAARPQPSRAHGLELPGRVLPPISLLFIGHVLIDARLFDSRGWGSSIDVTESFVEPNDARPLVATGGMDDTRERERERERERKVFKKQWVKAVRAKGQGPFTVVLHGLAISAGARRCTRRPPICVRLDQPSN